MEEERICTFWFGRLGGPTTDADFKACTKRWFFRDPELDAECARLFGQDVARAARGELSALEATPRGRLVLVLLLDQLPRNLNRGSGLAFAQDAEALRVVLEGIARGADRELTFAERMMFYMPLMHAEDRALQEKSIEMFQRLHDEAPAELQGQLAGALDFAQRHKVVVDRFGRYPHRNAALGRASTAEEEEFLKQPGSSF